MNIEITPIERLLASEHNPRTEMDDARLNELAESIKSDGLLDPIRGVREGDHIRIESGHRRHMAAVAAGLTEVPVIVVEQDSTDEQIRALVTNVQREDLNVIDEARAYQHLIAAHGLTALGAAQRVGVSPTRVTQRLELLAFDDQIIHLFASGKLSPTTRTSLTAIAAVSPRMAIATAKMSAAKGWSVALTKDPGAVLMQLAKEDKKLVALPGSYDIVNFKIAKEVQATIDEFTKKEKYNPYRTIRFSKQDGDSAVAAGVGYKPKGCDYTFIDDAGWLGERVTDVVEREQKAAIERAKQDAAYKAAQRGPSVNDLPATEQEKQKELNRAKRQAELDARTIAHQHNLELGKVIVTELAKIDVGSMPMPLAHAIVRGLIGDRRSGLFMSGLRYCLPQYMTEEEVTKGKTTSIKRTYVEYVNEAGEKMQEWLDGAKTPSELVGRAVAALVASQYADQGCVPQSARKPTELPRGAEGQPYGRAMHEFAKVLVPKALQSQEKPSAKHVAKVLATLEKARQREAAKADSK